MESRELLIELIREMPMGLMGFFLGLAVLILAWGIAFSLMFGNGLIHKHYHGKKSEDNEEDEK